MTAVDPALAFGPQAALLGPFVLERVIGSGGMGEVWRAVHRDEQVVVAIKVIGQHWARQPSYRAAFGREVRAVAGLVHPGIVAVFDQGEVGAATAMATGLAPGSPYLVMEYMPRGSLEGLTAALDWPLVQVLVREVLAALAHAHARGVVHCDLKPGNVLLAGTDEVAIKLTDFGVAHTLTPSNSLAGVEPRSAGTPAYMAPEQLLGLWRDYGPWTDLYALGCMVWELCCGLPPFVAGSLVQLAGLHLHAAPGLFAPRFAVPPGLEGWLRRLLAKRAGARFACAADAAWALGRLPGGTVETLLWAAVGERVGEVDRAAQTQPLVGPAGPATTGRAAVWSAASTVIAAGQREAVDVVAATRATGEPLGVDVVAATRATGEPLGVDVVAATRATGEPLGVDGVAATRVAAGAGSDPTVAAGLSLGTGASGVSEGTGGLALGTGASGVSEGTGGGGRSEAIAAAPTAGSWRRAEDVTSARPLRGAGLALYRFREVPLVGRLAEREALWAGLVAVHAEGRPRGLVVRGPSGVGKSRLVEWLATRSSELGAATVLRASHGRFGGAGDGLSRMLASELQCVGLGGDEAFERVLEVLGGDGPKDRSPALRDEAAALTEYMLPGAEDGARPRVRLAEQRERHAVLLGFLRRRTRERPALVWVDDAMWGPEALDFTRLLLTGRGGPRVLVVLTVRDDVVAERPAEARLIAELAALPGMTSVEVAPLCEAEHRALIRERLGLEAGLVETVLERAGGNPMFSVQLVGDWVARGVLVAGAGGFALAADASPELPDGMHALWQERLARLLAQHYAEAEAGAARQALELAAVIGLEVDPGTWTQGCAIEGIVAPGGLVDLLVAQGLALPSRAGWSFVHGMLRESLEDLADTAGRRALHHRCCAAILRARGQGHAEALARHLIAAGDLAAAMEPLLEATYQMQLAGQYDRAERVLGEHAALADRCGVAAEDVRRLRGRMQAVWLTWMRGGDGSLALARARCREVEGAARRGGHDDVLGEALRWHGLVGRFERRFAESQAALVQAAAAFARAGDVGGQARTALAAAVTLRAVGALDAAEAELAEAERLARSCGLTLLLPRIAGNRAELALQREDWGAAALRFGEAIAAAEASGDRKALALTLGGAGDLGLLSGRLAAADESYARAEALFASLGSRYVHGVRLHRTTVKLLRGEREAAQVLLREFVAGKGHDPLHLGLAHAALALAAGQAGRWLAFDAGIAAAEQALAQVGEGRPVIVRVLHEAEAAARACGEHERAARAGALAQTQTRWLRAGAG